MVDSVGLRSGSVRSAWVVNRHVVDGEEGEGVKQPVISVCYPAGRCHPHRAHRVREV